MNGFTTANPESLVALRVFRFSCPGGSVHRNGDVLGLGATEVRDPYLVLRTEELLQPHRLKYEWEWDVMRMAHTPSAHEEEETGKLPHCNSLLETSSSVADIIIHAASPRGVHIGAPALIYTMRQRDGSCWRGFSFSE